MEITKLIVLLWFMLPILVYLTDRLRQKFITKKYSLTTTAIIVGVSRIPLPSNSEGNYLWIWMYTYTVDGIEYYGKRKELGSPNHKIDEAIPIRYDPIKPHRSSAYQPLSRQDGIISGAIWLTFSLGIAFCFIALGNISTPVIPRLLRCETWSKLKPIHKAGILGFLVIELLLTGIGVYVLIKIGFVRQNLLWYLWTF